MACGDRDDTPQRSMLWKNRLIAAVIPTTPLFEEVLLEVERLYTARWLRPKIIPPNMVVPTTVATWCCYWMICHPRHGCVLCACFSNQKICSPCGRLVPKRTFSFTMKQVRKTSRKKKTFDLSHLKTAFWEKKKIK